MNPHIIELCSLASLLILWVGVFWLYRDYKIDAFRQKMFALRDEMFDDAIKGRVSFDDDIYGMLRTMINGAIRFAHNLNFMQFLFFLFGGMPTHPGEQNFGTRLKDNMQAVSIEKRKVYAMRMQQMHKLILAHMLLASPLVLVTIVLPLAFVVALKWCFAQLGSLFADPINRAEELAYAAGGDEPQQATAVHA